MKIRLRVPYRGLEPGDEIEVNDYEAATLICHGVAEDAGSPVVHKRKATTRAKTRTAEEPGDASEE